MHPIATYLIPQNWVPVSIMITLKLHPRPRRDPQCTPQHRGNLYTQMAGSIDIYINIWVLRREGMCKAQFSRRLLMLRFERLVQVLVLVLLLVLVWDYVDSPLLSHSWPRRPINNM
ncbi:hypothetical protein DFH27DRAFT_522847 [Peziza echinospora]|nr:hypothetical protein DFH27DRAFT_522847 [Peziza echinospora]